MFMLLNVAAHNVSIRNVKVSKCERHIMYSVTKHTASQNVKCTLCKRYKTFCNCNILWWCPSQGVPLSKSVHLPRRAHTLWNPHDAENHHLRQPPVWWSNPSGIVGVPLLEAALGKKDVYGEEVRGIIYCQLVLTFDFLYWIHIG